MPLELILVSGVVFPPLQHHYSRLATPGQCAFPARPELGKRIGDLSSTETGTVHSAEHRKDGDPTTLARFLLGRVNRIEYKLLMVRQAVHPPYRYWIETARLRWIARGECPNARRNDRRMRSRFPKPFFLAISSAEKRPVSIIKRADSTRSCWIA